jgi:hypothetical protein
MSLSMPPGPDHLYVIAAEIMSGLTALCGLILLFFKLVRERWRLSDEAKERKRRRQAERDPESPGPLTPD